MRNSPQHLKPEQRNSRADHITEEMTEYLDCVAKTHVPCTGCPAGKGRIGRLWETAPPPRSPARLAVRSTSGRRGGSGGSAGPSPSQRRASVGSDLALASPFWGLCPWSPLRLRLPQRDIPASPLGLPPCVSLQRGPPRPTTEDHGPTWSPQHEPGAALRPSRGPHPRGRVAAAPSGENAHCNSPGAWELSMGRRLKCPGEQAPVPQGGVCPPQGESRVTSLCRAAARPKTPTPRSRRGNGHRLQTPGEEVPLSLLSFQIQEASFCSGHRGRWPGGVFLLLP